MENLSTKDKLREEVERETEKFLSQGGEISKAPPQEAPAIFESCDRLLLSDDLQAEKLDTILNILVIENCID